MLFNIYDVGRARLAHVDPAAVLRAGDAQQVAQDPQESYVVLDVDRYALAVDDEGLFRHEVLLRRSGRGRWWATPGPGG